MAKPRRLIDERESLDFGQRRVRQLIRDAGDGETGGATAGEDVHILVTTVTYNGDDQVTRVDFEDSTYRLITYTAGDLVDTIEQYSSAATLLSTHQAAYNGSDQVTGWTLL